MWSHIRTFILGFTFSFCWLLSSPRKKFQDLCSSGAPRFWGWENPGERWKGKNTKGHLCLVLRQGAKLHGGGPRSLQEPKGSTTPLPLQPSSSDTARSGSQAIPAFGLQIPNLSWNLGIRGTTRIIWSSLCVKAGDHPFSQ